MKVFWEFRHVISVFYIIFRRGAPQGGLSCPFGAIHLLYVAKNSSHGATCEEGPALWAGPSSRQSGVQGPSGIAGGALRCARVPCPGRAGAATLRSVRGIFPAYTPPGKMPLGS